LSRQSREEGGSEVREDWIERHLVCDSGFERTSSSVRVQVRAEVYCDRHESALTLV
jgi:hypothetical protein